MDYDVNLDDVDYDAGENALEELDTIPKIENDNDAPLPVIKVLGVGGSGGNAVRHMYNKGIIGVDFIVCDTDKQKLNISPIPVKLQLGKTGWGAGADPEVGNKSACESEEDIRMALQGTNMVFITAGMGGGTGTGAAPIIASIAKEMEILTVGIITYPFDFEGKEKYQVASAGVHEMGQNVDSLLVIKNQNLFKFFPTLKMDKVYAQADEVLFIAAKGVAEVITKPSYVNLDFNDVKTILYRGGVSILTQGLGKGENRAEDAIEAAVTSPLLDTNSVYGAGKVLLFISSPRNNLMESWEFEKITEILGVRTCGMQDKFIHGLAYDDELADDEICVTVIASHLNGTLPETPVKKFNLHREADETAEKKEAAVAKKKAPAEQDGKPNLFSRQYPDFRDKTEHEWNKYLDVPAISRTQERTDKMQERNQGYTQEASPYQASANGQMNCQPAYFKSLVD